MGTGAPPARQSGHGITSVVFDLGGVLIDWNPRYLYRGLFDGDDGAMERFLVTICTPGWHYHTTWGGR